MTDKLLETLKDCFYRNEAFFKKIECSKQTSLLVSKYPYTDYEIKVVNDGTKIVHWFNHLLPFDCFDMIRELKAGYA